MKKAIIIALASLFLSGCLPAVDGKDFYLSSKEKKEMLGLCRSLNKIGILHESKQEIRSDMDAIKQLISEGNFEESQDQIIRLNQNIRDNTGRIMSLAELKYIEPNYRQRLQWTLTGEELGLGKEKTIHWWKIKSVKVLGVYDWSGENQQLAKRVDLTVGERTIDLRLQRSASLIDICQLQQTIVVALQVEFQSPFSVRPGVYRLLAKNTGEP